MENKNKTHGRKRDRKNDRKIQGKKSFGKIWLSSWWPILVVVILCLIVITYLLFSVQNTNENALILADIKQQENDLEQLQIEYDKEADRNPEAAYENAMTGIQFYADTAMENTFDVYVYDREKNVVAERKDSLYLRHIDEEGTHYYRCADENVTRQVLEIYQSRRQVDGPGFISTTVRIDEAYIRGSECYPVRVNIYSLDTETDEEGNEELCYKLAETVLSTKNMELDYDEHLTGLDVLEGGKKVTEGLEEVAQRKAAGLYYVTALLSVTDKLPEVRQNVEEYILNDIIEWEDTEPSTIEFQGYNYRSYMGSVIPVRLGEEWYYFVMVAQERPMEAIGGYVIAAWIIGLLGSALIAFAIAKGFARTMRKEQELVCRQRDYTNALAHDLKTPLMAISGYTENLQSQVNPGKQEHYYEAIYSNIDYMNRLIMDMLNLAKLQNAEESLQKSNIDLRCMTEKVASCYEQEIEKKKLRLKIEGNGSIEADSGLLERALKNLVENAVKYSPAGEAVSIQLSDGFIQITNTGVTLPKEKWDVVFQPFVKGDEVRERESGTGLGLAIVRDIANLHGFQCRLECEENSTTVTLS